VKLDPAAAPAFVGPHEGRELDLMLAGTKPLSMFVEIVGDEVELFSEANFDALVSQGRLIKRVTVKSASAPGGKTVQTRQVLYALPNEEWRIPAFLHVQDLYDSLVPGWRFDLDRVMGLLLGYEHSDIESFVKRVAAQQGVSTSQ
jgi:hypothetical protein